MHLHPADRPELIFAQGRPFVINACDHIGDYPGMQAAESGRAWTALESQRRHRIEGELPAPNSVLRIID